MRTVGNLLAALLASLAPAPAASQIPDRLHSQRDLRVTFIGSQESERGGAFLRFLRQHFEHAKAVERTTFVPDDLAGSDVVVVDWPQQEGVSQWMKDRSKKPVTPFGDRDAWTLPMVLVGSAGLNLAAAWEVKGGFG
jgi:hypothetical protein